MPGSVKGIIILEGADGTGKTTLAKALVEKYGGIYIHNRYHKEIWPFFMASMRWAIRESQRRLVVIDRHWISECIYARVYRGGSKHSWDVRAFYRVLRRYGALYVICAPPVDAVVENHRKLKGNRKEMYDDVTEVAHRYYKLWFGGMTPPENEDYAEQLSVAGVVGQDWCHYDYTEATDDVSFKREICYVMESLDIIRHWNITENDFFTFPYPLDIAGNLNKARAILVADKPGGNRPNWPFCCPVGSSSYLNKTLHQLRVHEGHIAIINANGEHGHVLMKALRQIDHAPVITLGGAAARACDNHGVVYRDSISHPQFARRFHFHGDGYALALKRALDTVGFAAYLPKR